MFSFSFSRDPRYFQVFFQSFFLFYGILFLDWPADWQHYACSIGGCLTANYLFESARLKRWLPLTGADGWKRWGFSVLISAMGLCLLLKTNHASISLLAAFLSIGSKYIFRWKGKHIFNPSAFGIVAVLLMTDKAWLSPGQWGAGTILFFAVISLGYIVVTRVQKLDVSLGFLLVYAGLFFWRQVVYLDWPVDFFIHSVSTGSLLLFTFFMISDPKTTPDHPVARIIWSGLIAFLAFYFSAYQWKYNTPVWTLVFAAPLVPLFDRIWKADRFQWHQSGKSQAFFSKFKHIAMRTFFKKTAASLILVSMLSHEAWSFCGFYVAKADGTLKNKTSQVILVRDGNRSVITMSNDYKGDARDFALVVPVPVVLKKSDISVVDAGIFDRLNDYSKPRLVEYFDENPCSPRVMADALEGKLSGVTVNSYSTRRSKNEDLKVKVEAQYTVGEYDIVILSAEESGGLKKWLDQNGYQIPHGAEEVLDPYIKSNLKFFVVKVNLEEQKKLGVEQLRPIQIRFDSPKFILPIRLGMANADGDQDMIVYAFTRTGRIESVNYRTISLPTGKNIPLFVKENFGSFYSNLFEHQWKREGRNLLFLEYAWDVSPSNYVKCDPCVSTPPDWNDLKQAGVWWLNKNRYNDYVDEYEPNKQKVHFTRLHVRYNRKSFPQDLIFQATPNKDNYQARYIVTHPATGGFECEAGKKYLKDLKQRRQDEMEMLSYLTGKGYDNWDVADMKEEKLLPQEASYLAMKDVKTENRHNMTGGIVFSSITLLGFLMLGATRKRKEKIV